MGGDSGRAGRGAAGDAPAAHEVKRGAGWRGGTRTLALAPLWVWVWVWVCGVRCAVSFGRCVRRVRYGEVLVLVLVLVWCRALRRLRGGQHEEFRPWTGRPISIAAMSTILIQRLAHLTSPTHRSTAAPPHPPPQPPAPRQHRQNGRRKSIEKSARPLSFC